MLYNFYKFCEAKSGPAWQWETSWAVISRASPHFCGHYHQKTTSFSWGRSKRVPLNHGRGMEKKKSMVKYNNSLQTKIYFPRKHIYHHIIWNFIPIGRREFFPTRDPSTFLSPSRRKNTYSTKDWVSRID